jgi:hypothetical protein
MSKSVVSSLSFLGVQAVPFAQGFALVASGQGRIARLAHARRVLLSSGWVVSASQAWRVGAGALRGLHAPVLFAFSPR